jgi:hypothetical protein
MYPSTKRASLYPPSKIGIRIGEFLIEKADLCSLLAKHATRSCGTHSELPAALASLGHELMAKAVEIETARQKTARAP